MAANRPAAPHRHHPDKRSLGPCRVQFRQQRVGISGCLSRHDTGDLCSALAPGHWTATRLPRTASVADTVVFSPHDAWVFAYTGSGTHRAAYDLRFNGRKWHATALPGAAYEVSSVSPDDIWAVGTSFATLNSAATRKPG